MATSYGAPHHEVQHTMTAEVTEAGCTICDLEDSIRGLEETVRLLEHQCEGQEEMIRELHARRERQEELINELREQVIASRGGRDIATYSVASLLPQMAEQIKLLERAGHTVTLRGRRGYYDGDSPETPERPGADYLVLSIEPEGR